MFVNINKDNNNPRFIAVDSIREIWFNPVETSKAAFKLKASHESGDYAGLSWHTTELTMAEFIVRIQTATLRPQV